MTTNIKTHPITKTPERKTRHLPPGHRVLHVTVPEEIFNAAKAKALLLGVEWPYFVVELLKEADPRRGGTLVEQIGPATSAK